MAEEKEILQGQLAKAAGKYVVFIKIYKILTKKPVFSGEKCEFILLAY